MEDTLIRPTPTITAAAPLSEDEGDSLLLASASMERTAKVKAGTALRSESRSWSRGGNVD